MGVYLRKGAAMAQTMTYTVPGMSCDHCVHAVTGELSAVSGVQPVDVDLATKLVARELLPVVELGRVA